MYYADQLTIVDLLAVTDDAHETALLDRAVADLATGNFLVLSSPDVDAEGLTNIGFSDDFLGDEGRQSGLEHGPDVVEDSVDDVILEDFDAFRLGALPDVAVGGQVEGDDVAFGGFCQVDV